MSVTFVTFCRKLLTSGGLAAGFFATTAANIAQAALPRAVIDVGTTVECRDVTPADFVAAHPQEKIIEAKFRFSVLLIEGREPDLEELQLTIDSPQRRLRVVDFQPRTELASDLAGDVEVCNTDDRTQSLNASLGGVVSGDQGPAHAQVTPAAGVGVTQNRGSKETYHRLPPKQLVLASGTTNAEHGVFFKWRRTSQIALEGSREVTCRLLVPHDWTGDWVQFHCDILGRHKNYFTDKVELSGRAQTLVALYLSGDSVAQHAAIALALAQTSGETIGSASSRPGARNHTAYKPSVPADRHTQDWFSLPTFKLCGQQRDASASSDAALVGASATLQGNLPKAAEQLRELSGTSISTSGN
jgi:hypothetical protein